MLRFWLAFSGISKPEAPHAMQEAMVARGRRNCITSIKDLRAESFQTYSNASEEEILEGEEDDEDGEGSQTKGVTLTTDGETKPTTTQLKISPTIVLHYSPFKSAWDWLILLLVLYVAVVVPYMAAFRSSEQFPGQATPQNATNYSDYQTMPQNASNFSDFQTTPQTPPQNTTTFSDFLIRTLLSDKFVICDMVVDFLFMVDILVNFRTTYLYNGELIVKPGKIAINYLRGWFLIDFVSAVPFDLIITIAKQTDTVTATALMKTARLLRLVRVARKMDQYSEYGASFLLLLMAFFTLIAHWLACIFYTIAENERLALPHPIGWLDWLANKTGSPYLVNDTSSGPNVQSKYITSLYFTFTILTSVGFGNISPVTDNEKIFSIFAMLLGSLMSAAIFGNVASIMLRMYQGSEEYHEKSSSIKEFIEFHHIPKNLASRLMESNQQSYWETNGIDMTKVLKSFPEGLQADICLHLNNTLLTKCPAFQNASPGCLRMLSVKFKSVHVPPGDTLIHQSDVLAEAFFVSRGTIEITKDGVVVAILTKNDIFGEEMSKIIQKTLCKGSSLSYRSKYLVRALSYCDLHKILISDLIITLRYYPEFAVDFFQRFQMTFNLCSKFDQEISRNSSDVNLSSNGLKDENLEPFEISPSIQHLFKVVSQVSTQGEEAEVDADNVEGDGKDSSGAEEQDGTNRRTSILSSPDDPGNPVIVIDMQDSMSASLMWDNTDLEDGGGILFQRHQPQMALDNDDEDATLIGSPTSTISGYNYFNAEETRTPFDLDPSERPLATTPTIGSMASSYHEQHRMAHIESRLQDINNRLLKLDRDMSVAVDAIMEYLVPEVYNEDGVRVIDWQ